MAASDLLHGQIANRPIIYAYSDTRYPNMLKVGYTSRAIEVRMKEHYLCTSTLYCLQKYPIVT